jgi:hypothetical protein
MKKVNKTKDHGKERNCSHGGITIEENRTALKSTANRTNME